MPSKHKAWGGGGGGRAGIKYIYCHLEHHIMATPYSGGGGGGGGGGERWDAHMSHSHFWFNSYQTFDHYKEVVSVGGECIV